MIQVFDEAPNGLQPAPHDPRMLAAGHQVAVREINFRDVHDKESLMLAFLRGLGLSQTFGRNWDALYDVLTDPESRPAKSAVLLCSYASFRKKHPHLSADLERVMLDAQATAAEAGRSLWLLLEEPDSDTRHW
ncbi:barstar family protein [Deinococcus koreensis]|uniref:Nuclease inhibitor n=1 Tax=Deinococcus koreensis TaxID=2054903 RepID=A0A2K3UU64_9DEIO|nr:barstar family protein [Deinococcus koreensis]PNY80084.1 nuclease inhibitor [Deinococcus koreensis]